MGNLLDLFVFKYNRTDFHELNLDWIISDIRVLAETLKNFININTIKYADPIQWNITSQYEANTVVIDPATGTAYLSSQPVPSGVAISNAEYWTVIFTLDLLSANQNITLRDDGNNVLATFASAQGDWLIWNNTLYKVSQPINVNEAYVAGYNLDRFSVELFIKEYINDVLTIIGDLDDLDTTDKTNIVNAINDVVAMIGDLADLDTADKTNIVNAINDVVTMVGDLNTLTTTDKDSVVDAINELNTKINENEIKWYLNPINYGAVGDGVTDDSAAVNDAIDDLQDGYALFIPSGYVFNCGDTALHAITTKNFSIVGGGVLKNCTVVIGDGSSGVSVDYNGVVDGITIDNDDYTIDCVQLHLARNVRFSNCYFKHGLCGIRGVAYNERHGTALINIQHCRFYCLSGIIAETISGSWALMNDWTITGNIFHMVDSIAIHLTGIDGAVISNNVCFFNNSVNNLQNILIDGVANDQIIITGNQLFEASREGILLIANKGATIIGNNIVWCGQRLASSGIKISGSQDCRTTISGNRIETYTKHGIEIEGSSSKYCSITGNSMRYGSEHYIGSEDLTVIPHYGVYLTGPSSKMCKVSANNSNVEDYIYGANDCQFFRLNESMRNLYLSISVTAANTPICNIKSNRDTANGGGLLIINSMMGENSGAPDATYILGVATAGMGGATCSEIFTGGYTGGLGVNHPGFTFSIANNILYATPKGSASGTFNFGIQSIGDLSISAITS